MNFNNPLSAEIYRTLITAPHVRAIRQTAALFDKQQDELNDAVTLTGVQRTTIDQLREKIAKLEQENMTLEDENDQLRTAMQLAGFTPPPLPVVNVNPDFEKMLLAMPGRDAEAGQ